MLLALAFAATAIGASVSTSFRRPHFEWDDTNFVLAFGDSYTYVDGLQGHQNYSFIGDMFKLNYTAEQLLTNEIRKNQTSAGGPNWVEYLTDCFEGRPSRCKKQLWDFAFAGSDISVEFTPLHHNYTVDLLHQIDQWHNNGYKYLKVHKDKALVVVWIGINDINDSRKYAYNITGPLFTTLYTKMITTQFKAMETLYAEGFKNYLVMGLPTLDKTPSNLLTSNPQPNATMIANWDNILAENAKNFESRKPGTNVFVFDTYGYLNGVLANATQENFTDISTFCQSYAAADIGWNYASYGCSPIYNYFWFNSGHITYHAHKLLARGVDKFLRGKSC